MSDTTRAHQRVERREIRGDRFTVDGLLPKPVSVFIPARPDARLPRLLIHFHGSAWVAEQSADATDFYAIAVVHLGAGSSVYERPFRDDPALFTRLLDAIRQHVAFRGIDLSAFSAGYGAIRAILSDKRNLPMIRGVLLLDGLHTSYVPEGKVLAEGGRLDEARLEPFLRFARLAAQGDKALVITHSEIFPGTFASTTETADYLLRGLGLKRTPVVQWGPLGMQQLSEVKEGSLLVLGFAGNTAPDHVDHFHGMSEFLALLE